MKVTLLTCTKNPEQIIASAAKLCYSSKADIRSLMEDMTKDKVQDFIAKLETARHCSPFEHVSYTFGIEGVSRAFLAQITRHRIASFSVRSQRYCGEEKFDYAVPEALKRNEKALQIYIDTAETCREAYKKLTDMGISKEDARMLLPNACDTRMVVTMNVRELWHFFNLRCCSRASWEIRAVANEMLRLCKQASPLLFQHAGPSCVKGYCPEGSMSCGKAPTIEKLLMAYKGSR